MYAAASMIPLRALAGKLAQDPRISATPVVDKALRRRGRWKRPVRNDFGYVEGLQTM